MENRNRERLIRSGFPEPENHQRAWEFTGENAMEEALEHIQHFIENRMIVTSFRWHTLHSEERGIPCIRLVVVDEPEYGLSDKAGSPNY